MTGGSLRARLLLTAIVSIAVSLVVAWFGLVMLFERHVERRVDTELSTYIRQLAGALSFPGNKARLTKRLADRRFEQVYSGLYWQIQEDAGTLRVRSRSLWDYVLPLPPDELATGVVHRHELPGPKRSQLLVQERQFIFKAPRGDRRIRVALAIDKQEIVAVRNRFATETMLGVAILGLLLGLAAWAQIHVGLHPLEAVRRGVASIRSRQKKTLDGAYPREVVPLVNEVNELLSAQERYVSHARKRAGDLAHGLKTPLTVLASDVRKLRERGETKIAGEIEGIAEAMRRHIDHEMARTRIAIESRPSGRLASASDVVGKIIATVRRTPKGDALTWDNRIPKDLEMRIDSADLTEIVGNLIDNAANWARSDVVVAGGTDNRTSWLEVSDDGPGISADQMKRLGERGLKLDESASGTGIGLSIVKDILAAYGGRVGFSKSSLGGLCARIELGADADIRDRAPIA